MRIAAFFMFMLLVPGMLLAQVLDNCLPESRNRLVNDYTNTLKEHEIANLEMKLVSFSMNTSNQIAVVITDDLCGSDAAAYAFALGNKWGVGQADFKNGIVIVVKPTGGPGDRKVFIATGYGLEGAIPDATAKIIVEREIIPRFKQGDIYGGLDQATTTLMQLAKGEINSSDYAGKQKKPSFWFLLLPVVLFGFFFWNSHRRAKKYADLNGVSLATAYMLLNQMNRSHRGRYSSFGGSGFGGGGGGGFGGFGGGSFGGGGAGGSW